MDQQYSEGRTRLRRLLCGVSFLSCAAMMAAVLIGYGTPYNPIWWGGMAAILAAAAVAPLLLVAPIEWVITGYRQDVESSAAPAERDPAANG